MSQPKKPTRMPWVKPWVEVIGLFPGLSPGAHTVIEKVSAVKGERAFLAEKTVPRSSSRWGDSRRVAASFDATTGAFCQNPSLVYRQVTDEDRAAIALSKHRSALVERVQRAARDADGLPTETLEALCALLDKAGGTR